MDSSDCIKLEINSLHYIKLFEIGLSPSLLIKVIVITIMLPCRSSIQLQLFITCALSKTPKKKNYITKLGEEQ